MQLQLRIDNDNYVTIDFQLSPADTGQLAASPEIAAATITDRKLSQLKETDLFDLTGQLVDYFTTQQQALAPQADWRDEWLAATKT